jgi:hypothetical protein
MTQRGQYGPVYGHDQLLFASLSIIAVAARSRTRGSGGCRFPPSPSQKSVLVAGAFPPPTKVSRGTPSGKGRDRFIGCVFMEDIQTL